MNGNACIIVWNADGVSGVVHVLKEGLIEEKVVSISGFLTCVTLPSNSFSTSPTKIAI